MNRIKHFDLLGCKARDKITGFSGVVSSVCFDLYGCVQIVLTPGADKEGKLGEGHWFDEKRIEVLDRTPVMPVPSFEHVPGPSIHPVKAADPARR